MLIPAALAISSFLAPAAPVTQPPSSITSFVAASGGEFDNNPFDYDLLLNAVITADLAEALANPNANLTLFAPNDRAFILLARDLGFNGSSEAGAWEFLVDALTGLGGGNPVPVLQQVLLYHVAPSRVNVIQFILLSITGQTIPTLQGGTVRPVGLSLVDKDPDFTNPTVFFPLNVRTGNGIVHTITRVLLPLNLP